ncbi:MAG: phage tail tape measure protein [Coriobacteriales bacterium]|nr:phage tail tape measure protein [Coriobacteriales bacterium]
MPGGVEVAKAFVTIIPTTRGAQGEVEKAVVPAASSAGDKAGVMLGSKLLAGFKKFAAPIAAVVSIASVKKIASESVDAFTSLAGQTKGLQRIMGGTAEEVSSISGAMKLAGMDTDKANASLTIFSKKLSAAASDGEKAKEMSKTLGFSILDSSGKLKSMNDILPQVADKFASMPDGVEKTALATQLFGRSGAAMLPFLNKGAAGIEELKAKAKELGIVLDDDAMNKFAAYKGAVREWDTALQGAKVSIGEALVPFITMGTHALTDGFVPAIQTGAKVVSDFLSGLSGEIDVDGFKSAIQGVTDAFADGLSGGDGVDPASIGKSVGDAVNGLIPILESAKEPAHALGEGIKFVGDNADTIIPAVLGVATGIKLLKAASTAASTVKGVGTAIASIAERAVPAAVGLGATAVGEEAAGAAGATSATQILAAAVAVVALGAGVLLASVGMYVLANAAVLLASGGAGAVAVMVGMVAVMAGLAIGAAILGPALTAGAVGMVAFGAALVLAGVGFVLVSAGISIMAAQLPIIAAFGLTAAAGILAMSMALLLLGPAMLIAAPLMVVFGAGAIVAGAALVVLGAGATVAGAGLMVLGAGVQALANAFLSLFMVGQMVAAGISSAFAGMRSALSGIFGGIKGMLTQPFEAAKDFISNIPGKIQGFFAGMHIELPHISLPHFSLSGNFDPLHGQVPSLSVDWYASGAVFAPNSPRVIGIGDNTRYDEAALPLSPSVLAGIGAGIAGEMDDSGVDTDEVITWLSDNLPRIIATSTPVMGERDFDRRVRSAIV